MIKIPNFVLFVSFVVNCAFPNVASFALFAVTSLLLTPISPLGQEPLRAGTIFSATGGAAVANGK